MSESLVGKTQVSGAFYQREAELVRCGVVENASGLKTGLELAFTDRLVFV